MTDAVNHSEQFVYDVCRKSFLSLWSYVNPQGRSREKELCDILVVCDPHVIVISVKEIKLGETGDHNVDRDRWQRKAVEASQKQIAGAVRWLDDAKVVVTNEGVEGLALPSLESRVYHRIAVAFGGRGKVPIRSGGEKGGPFVHVLDETTFCVILTQLDTITDFTQYLVDKEAFAERASIFITGGEEDLLALYLNNGRQFPVGPDFVMLQDDIWDGFIRKPAVIAKQERDLDSYIWDELIESFCSGGFCGPNWRGPGIKTTEQALRVLARENRFCRRVLGRSFRDFLQESKAGKTRSRCARSLSGVVYVFFAYDPDSTLEQRRHELMGRCYASLCLCPETSTIIGIDMNVPGEKPRDGYTSDLVMLHADSAKWTEADFALAQRFRDQCGYFKTPNVTTLSEDEYPVTRKKRRTKDVDSNGKAARTSSHRKTTATK